MNNRAREQLKACWELAMAFPLTASSYRYLKKGKTFIKKHTRQVAMTRSGLEWWPLVSRASPLRVRNKTRRGYVISMRGYLPSIMKRRPSAN